MRRGDTLKKAVWGREIERIDKGHKKIVIFGWTDMDIVVSVEVRVTLSRYYNKEVTLID